MKTIYFILFIWFTITILMYIICNLTIKESLKWPPKKQKNKLTHRHPTVLYLDSNGNYKPQRHTHEASIYTNTDLSYDSEDIKFSKRNDNNLYFKFKNRKKKKGIHYTIPIPVDKDKKPVDITSNISSISRKLWDPNPNLDPSDATGYIYTTDNPIIYKLLDNGDPNVPNDDPNIPYGDIIYNDDLDEKTKKDLRKWYKGKKHHHYKEKHKGTAKGW